MLSSKACRKKKALSRDLDEVREESGAMVVTWHLGGVF